MRTFLTAMALLVCVIGTAASKRVSAMSRKILIVLVAAAALNTGASANALAKGGVVHLFTHPVDGGGGFRQGHFERSSGAYLGGDALRARMRIGPYQFVGGLHHYEWAR